MAVLTPVDAAVAGVADNLVAAAGGGDSFANNGLTLFVAVNGSGAPITVTFDDPNSPTPVGATAFNPDVATAVPAGARRTFGPFPPFRFGSTVNVSYSGVTSLTVMPLRINP